jgi:hypothetical protein
LISPRWSAIDACCVRAGAAVLGAYSRALRVTFTQPFVQRDVTHELGVTPDGMFVVWSDASIVAAPGVPWTDKIATVMADGGNAHAVLIFYTLREDQVPGQPAIAASDVYVGPAVAVAAHHVTHEPGGSDALQLTAASRLFGRGNTGAGEIQELALGTGLSIAGTTLALSSHHATHEPGGADALQLTAASRLFGRGSSGAGAVQELVLGSGLSMSGTTLAATGALVIQTTTVAGLWGTFALTAGVSLLRINNATQLLLSGFTAGYDGQELTVVSIGAGQVDLAHENAGSAPADRLLNVATSVATSLAPGAGRAVYRYDATTARWRLIFHDQGAPIAYATMWTAVTTPPSLGNGQINMLYTLKGRAVDVFVQLSLGSTTTLGAGTWTFQLPFAVSGVPTVGSGFITSLGVNHPVISNVIGNVMYGVLTATDANVDSTHPAGLNTGDLLRMVLAGYPVA